MKPNWVKINSTATAKIKEIGLKVIPHPPYSSDLSPSDYYLFRNLKKKLVLRSYQGLNEIEEAIRYFFLEKERAWFSAGIDELPDRFSRLLDLNGRYHSD